MLHLGGDLGFGFVDFQLSRFYAVLDQLDVLWALEGRQDGFQFGEVFLPIAHHDFDLIIYWLMQFNKVNAGIRW